jgi:sporulation protein YlmC with PRC-barrel domain
MFAKTVTAALASTALLAAIASAQTPDATTNAPSNTISSAALQGDWRASKVVGLSVYNENNESLGSINDLLMDRSGNIKAAILGVGGFLGLGAHLVAVPLDKIKFVNEPVVYTGTAGAGGAGGAMNRPATTTTGSAATGTAAAGKPNPWYPDHAVFNANRDELKAMPEFRYSE